MNQHFGSEQFLNKTFCMKETASFGTFSGTGSKLGSNLRIWTSIFKLFYAGNHDMKWSCDFVAS